ncbi:hypothetical protein [Agrobacterium sp. CG674]
MAAVIAWTQYRRTRSIAELDANLKLISELNRLSKQQLGIAKDPDQASEVAQDFLELCEVYAASLEKGSLPTLSNEFIRDFLRYDFLAVAKHEPFRSLLQMDPNRRNHLKYLRHFAEIHGCDLSQDNA